jgi:hypothetical protein
VTAGFRRYGEACRRVVKPRERRSGRQRHRRINSQPLVTGRASHRLFDRNRWIWIRLAAFPVTGDRQPLSLAKTPFIETNATFSPDGRWIAFQTKAACIIRPSTRRAIETVAETRRPSWRLFPWSSLPSPFSPSH